GQEPENIAAHGVVALVRRSPDAFRGWISRVASGLLESCAAAPPYLLRQAGGGRSGAWLVLPGYLGLSLWSIWPSPDHVPDAELPGNQLEVGEHVGDLLLGLDHVRGDEPGTVALALDGLTGDLRGQADQRRNLSGGLVDVALHPLADAADLFDQHADHCGVLLGIGAGRQVELVVVHQATAVTQAARLQLVFGGGLEGIPDHPSVDTAALESGAGIGRRQVNRLDVAVLQAGIFQGAHQQVVHVGALVQGDLLALQLADRLDRRILRQQDRLATRRWRLVGDVEQIGT